MKILFICSRNDQRSKTAERHFSSKYPAHQFKSAGTNYKKCEQLNSTKLTDELLTWADLIFVMQQHHHNMIRKYGTVQCDDKITVLDISDDYQDHKSALINVLEDKIKLK